MVNICMNRTAFHNVHYNCDTHATDQSRMRRTATYSHESDEDDEDDIHYDGVTMLIMRR